MMLIHHLVVLLIFKDIKFDFSNIVIQYVLNYVILKYNKFTLLLTRNIACSLTVLFFATGFYQTHINPLPKILLYIVQFPNDIKIYTKLITSKIQLISEFIFFNNKLPLVTQDSNMSGKNGYSGILNFLILNTYYYIFYYQYQY